MASESVNAFIRKMNRDYKFADKILRAVNEACISVAQEAGIHMTPRELDDALSMLMDGRPDPVSNGAGPFRGVRINGETQAGKLLN